MQRRVQLGRLVLSALAALPLAALADDETGVTTELTAEVRESEQTPERRETFHFAPATLLAQGQIVFYTVRIHNPTPVFINDVTVTQRIPANTRYIEGSAAGPAAQIFLSTDGGGTFLPEAAFKGRTSSKAASGAPPERCTHIRWTLRYALAPDASALARFRAVFE